MKMKEWDEINARKTAEERAMKRGLEKGIKKGIEQEKINIAKNLLDVLDNEIISIKTGLSIDIIQKLRY